MPILEVHNIEKHFGKTQVLSIIGSSGSGKTTLLRCLNFLETPDQGTITVSDQVIFDAADHTTQKDSDIRKKRLHFGLVFQNFNLFPQYTALENVTLARKLMAKETGESMESIQLAGLELLAQMGLAEKKTTMIIVTHEMAFARDVADQVIFMDGGYIVEQGTPQQVIEHPQEERTKQFLARYFENV